MVVQQPAKEAGVNIKYEISNIKCPPSVRKNFFKKNPYCAIIWVINFRRYIMKRLFIVTIAVMFAFNAAAFMSDGPPLPDYGEGLGADEQSDFLEAGAVEEQSTGSMLESGVVKPVFRPTDTPLPTPVPTLKPTPKPTAVPTKAPKPRPTAARVTPQFPAFAVTSAFVVELAQKRTASNYYGLFGGERKFTVNIKLENQGNTTAFHTLAEIVSGNTSIISPEARKNLQTVLPKTDREIVYPLVVLSGYDGDIKLPLTLRITANGMYKDYPLDLYIDETTPYILYIGAGLLLLIIIILIIAIARRGKNREKKGKDYDF